MIFGEFCCLVGSQKDVLDNTRSDVDLVDRNKAEKQRMELGVEDIHDMLQRVVDLQAMNSFCTSIQASELQKSHKSTTTKQ